MPFSLLPGGPALGDAYTPIGALAPARRRRAGRGGGRLFPALFYVILGLLNLGFLLLFGGTSFRASALDLWARVVPKGEVVEAVESPAEEPPLPAQYPPGENWYSGSPDEQAQPLGVAPLRPKAKGR